MKINLNGRFLSLFLLILFWFIISELKIVDKTLLASPHEVLRTYISAFTGKINNIDFFSHTFSTIKLAFFAWLKSMLIGIVLGLIIGQSKLLLNLTDPIFEFFRSIPPILVFPLLLVAYNYGNSAYVGTIIFGCLPIILITISNGISQSNKEPFMLFRSLNISKINMQFFYFLELLPHIILSSRLSFSLSLIIAIVCEMIFTPRSGFAIGSLAKDSQMSFDTPLFYTCVLTVGIYGYIINRVLIFLEQKI